MSLPAIGHTLTLVPLPGQIVVLSLLLACGLWAARAKTRLALVALLLCALFWLRANSHLEGMVLFSFTSAHGLTLADLLVPLVAAFVLTGQTERRRTDRERRTDGRVGGRRRDDPSPADPDDARSDARSEADPSAAHPDAGPARRDAGPARPDAGPARRDAGPARRDAGPARPDQERAAASGSGGSSAAGGEAGGGADVPQPRSPEHDRPEPHRSPGQGPRHRQGDRTTD